MEEPLHSKRESWQNRQMVLLCYAWVIPCCWLLFVAAKDAVPGTDFMPLQVEYKEKYSAFGRFPGGFTKAKAKLLIMKF